KLRALFFWGNRRLRFAFLTGPADLAGGMGRTASSIFEGSRDEDHLAFVSLAFSPVVDAFLAKGPRVIALEVVPRRMVSLVRSRVPFLAFLSRGLTRCYHPGDDGPSHLPLLGLTLTLLRLQVSHP